MSDIIQLLPDSVANQIAAGEVIQRPASVVKELVENALDSGATEIKIHIKDAGKTLIQISDNGCGMSPTDARMAFERHATSKISNANDLFAIRTMGFRGEALASVAAIANIELRTKRFEDEVGTFIHINGSEVVTQEPAACNNGTSLQVKNLFFNVPARRKFLKSNSTELKHILYEFQRVALPNPDIAFYLYHNNLALYELSASNQIKRILGLFGKNIGQSLVPVNNQTSIISISGFVGQPKFARKTLGEQFLFVNKRYFRHPYFHKSVLLSFEKLLAPETIPSYFLFFDINPEAIDINVHPTKTEIKFEDDRAIWQIVHAAVRESLGKHNVVPTIDFDQSGNIEIPVAPKPGTEVPIPKIDVDPDYNPFNEKSSGVQGSFKKTELERTNQDNWERLYEKKEFDEGNITSLASNEKDLYSGEESGFSGKKIMQFKGKYILTPVKSGLMVIDQKRAQERILFEKFMEVLKSDSVASQQQLFPQTIELNPVDAALLAEILDDLQSLGFDIREFGGNTFIINGTPGILDNPSPASVIEKLLEEYKNSPIDAKSKVREQVAASLAKAASINYGTELNPEEMSHLIDNLFACETPNYSPDGKPVLSILSLDNIEKSFLK
ncbi:MAG: DNA mismatch repair endonuclease MutL [Mariniphaga sp.]|nr:DNA mismatch repair endonuclease MutL [Mariniphaga sp.]